jgi:DNA gyrase subunit A
VLNQLYKHTALQSSFGVIMLALVNNRPKVMNIQETLAHHIEHRKIVITRRTKFDLQKAEARAHILEGLKIAVDNIDAVVKIIRNADDKDDARRQLMIRFKLSKIQSEAILEMRLHQLTGLEREELDKEYLEIIKTIERLRSILADPKKILALIKTEVEALKKDYGDARRTKIQAAEADFNIEDLIQEEDVAVTMSHAGYIKRIPLDTYKAQNRGGRGITGMTTKEEDFVENLFITSSHAYLLFFTSRGRLYWNRVYEIPEAGRASKGKAIVNLLQLAPEEKITAAIPIESLNPKKIKDEYLLMCTRNGTIKKIALEQFSNPRKGGIIAINLEDGDILTEVKAAGKNPEVLIAAKNGQAIHFKIDEVRAIGRTGMGVNGIEIEKDDEVVGMEVLSSKDIVLAVSENGYGKRTQVTQYRLTHRGGKGVINMQTTVRNGKVVGIKCANAGDEIMIMTQNGVTIRMRVDDISIISRNTQGVRLVKLDDGDKVAAIAGVVKEDDESAAALPRPQAAQEKQ